MSTVIKELIAKFTTDTTGVESGTSKAITAVTSFGKAALVAAGVAATAFAALAVHEAHVGDELGKASDRAGEATDSFIQLGHATELAGLSTEELSNVLKFMEKNVYDAAAGNKELEASLKRLGVSSKELLNLSPSEAFKKITVALGGLGSAAERTKIAMELFGRSGTGVLTLAQKGKDYFEAMTKEADRFGLTISRVDSEKLNDANDAVGKIGQAASGAARQFDVGLTPAITVVIEKMMGGVNVAGLFRNAGKELGEWFVKALDNINMGIDKSIIKILEGERAVRYWIVALKEKAGFDTTSDMNKIVDLTNQRNTVVRDYNSILKEQVGYQKDLNDLNKKYADQEAANKKKNTSMGGGLNVPLSKSATDEAKKAAREYAEQIKKSIEATVEYNNTIADQFISIKDGFLQGGKAADVFKKAALNALNEIANSMIKAAFKGAGSGGIFGSIASSIMGGFGGPLGGGSTFSKNMGRIDWLPSFAVGTNYVPKDMVAQIHEGEQIIPKGQRASGSNVTQNITINAGVSQTVRAEVMRMLPQIRQEAVRAVTENNIRGMTP